MSLLQQCLSQNEPPVPPPSHGAMLSAISLRPQATEQVGAPNPTALPSFSRWLAFTQPLPAVSAPPGFRELSAVFFEEHAQIAENQNLPECAGELRYALRNAPYPDIGQDARLSGVEQAYVLEDRSAIRAFIKRNRLLAFLLDAREPLAYAFGEAAVKKLTLVEDDDGCVTLFCLVLTPSSLDEAKRALNSFDESWWLIYSHEAGGKLNFDFELI